MRGDAPGDAWSRRWIGAKARRTGADGAVDGRRSRKSSRQARHCTRRVICCGAAGRAAVRRLRVGACSVQRFAQDATGGARLRLQAREHDARDHAGERDAMRERRAFAEKHDAVDRRRDRQQPRRTRPRDCHRTWRMPFIHSQNEKMLADSPYHSTRRPDAERRRAIVEAERAQLAPSGSISRKPKRCVYAQMSMARSVCVRRRDRMT